MTTLEINTSDIFAINKLKELAKEKFNFDINIIKTSWLDSKNYNWFKEDKIIFQESLDKYNSWEDKWYNEKEWKLEVNTLKNKLIEKYGNN